MSNPDLQSALIALSYLVSASELTIPLDRRADSQAYDNLREAIRQARALLERAHDSH